MKKIIQSIFNSWKEILTIIAFLLSLFNMWYTFFLIGSPIFSCTKWTAIQMIKNNSPHAAFAVQISIYNKGRVPLQVYDFILKAKTNDGQKVLYQAILLWDLRQWIEDGNREDKVGRAQKGQAPLPLIVTPGQLYDFNYPLMFLPLDVSSLINPVTANETHLTLYARTDRSDDYELIASQTFSESDMKELLQRSFVSLISSESTSKRQELLEKIK